MPVKLGLNLGYWGIGPQGDEAVEFVQAAEPMAGCTIDALSGGRFIFGFGPSGPQVSEGWYCVPYAKPWGRTREYVEVVRKVVAREQRLEYQGKHYTLPLPDGEGKALKLNFHPVRNHIPIFLGAIGRK